MRIFFVIAFMLTGFLVFAQEKPEGLFINSKAPEFKEKDQNGKEISLKELRKKRPVVLIFYRGNWCPYCSKYLKALEDSLLQIKDMGAELIAITPEAADGVSKTIEKTKASYSIISDKDLKIMKAYQVAYQVDERTIGRYKTAGIDLAQNNNQKPDKVFLPVPAIYIINKDGEISYRFFDPDYKKRASVKEILSNLVGMK